MADKVRVQELDSTSQEILNRLYNNKALHGRFGDVGCLQYMLFKEGADNYKNMTIRPDDIWVMTFPRSGTTWTQDLVWILQNDFDFQTASKIQLTERYIFLEMKHNIYIEPETRQIMDSTVLEDFSKIALSHDAIASAPSPRFIKTHLHLSLLPPNLLDTAKVVYVARDPRDVAVSYYKLTKLFRTGTFFGTDYTGDFKSFWNIFVKDLVRYTPFFPHLKEAWALRHHPNMMFIFYEDMAKDLPSTVKKIADFLGKEVTDDKVMKLCEHLDIKNFRKNKSVNMESFMDKIGNPNAESFVRKGKPGAWREHFDEEMAAQAQRWMHENLAGTDLRFPDNSSNVANLASLYRKS